MSDNNLPGNIFKTLGEFFSYPTCCIDHFCNSSDRSYISESNHVSKGSGFRPCPSCFIKTRNMDVNEFIEWLGRDPFITTEPNQSRAVARTKTVRFIKIAKQNRLNLNEYRAALFSI
jgi:hypothetical protein